VLGVVSPLMMDVSVRCGWTLFARGSFSQSITSKLNRLKLSYTKNSAF